jgi:hypothetical protein
LETLKQHDLKGLAWTGREYELLLAVLCRPRFQELVKAYLECYEG